MFRCLSSFLYRSLLIPQSWSSSARSLSGLGFPSHFRPSTSVSEVFYEPPSHGHESSSKAVLDISAVSTTASRSSLVGNLYSSCTLSWIDRVFPRCSRQHFLLTFDLRCCPEASMWWHSDCDVRFGNRNSVSRTQGQELTLDGELDQIDAIYNEIFLLLEWDVELIWWSCVGTSLRRGGRFDYHIDSLSSMVGYHMVTENHWLHFLERTSCRIRNYSVLVPSERPFPQMPAS